MSEANWNESEDLNPLQSAAMETLGCLCALGDGDALPMSRFAAPVRTGFGPAHDAARGILLEARRRGLAALALRSGCETVAEFPCACLPRPFTDAGLCYIGLGAPAIVQAAKALAEGPRARFFPADATNPASILRGLKDARGPICVLSAGLFPTVTDPELAPLCDALAQVLRDHGGCWLTPDPESPRAFLDILRALCAERYIDVVLTSNDMRQWKTAGQFDNALVIDPRWDCERLTQKAVARLRRHGLQAERVPMPPRSELQSVPAESPRRDAILRALDQQRCWKITASARAGARSGVSRADGLDIASERKGDLLRLWLTGRLDTLTSPALSECFAAHSEGLQSVEIDCAGLEYLSSSGLRALLQMLRHCPVTLCAINETVGDVLSKTGFDMLVQIKSGVMGDD